MRSLLLLLLGVWASPGAKSQMECQFSNCICLVPIGTFCNMAIQDLSGFQGLTTIQPGSFAQAGYIRNLTLSNNGILTLQNTSFNGLTNIISLDLSGNMLADLPSGLFSQMTRLVSLNLRRNSLTSVNPEAFRGLESLQILNLQSNQLGTFPADDLLPLLPSLTTLHLSGNPYDCSAPETAGLYFAVTTPPPNVADSLFVTCSNGTLVMDLNFDLPTPSPTSSAIVPSPTSSTGTGLSVSSTAASTTTSSSRTSQTGSVSATTTSSLSEPLVTSSVFLGPSPAVSVTPLIIVSVSPVSSTPFASMSRVTGSPPLAGMSTAPVPSPTPVVTTSTSVTVPGSCPEETTLTRVGYLSWSHTTAGEKTTFICPNGPSNAFAQRLCTASGAWSPDIEDDRCLDGSATEQLLASISSNDVTESNSEELSEQLASLSPESPLSLRELDTVTSLAAQLVAVGARDVSVLNNTLQALDQVLESSSSSLSEPQGAEISTRIRAIVDSLLLEALGINQTQLVLSFSHLAVGGAHLSATNSTHLLASIRLLMNGGVAVEVGSGDGDVVVETNSSSTIQVTVYDGNGLFMESQCPGPTATPTNTTVSGEVVTPIISVTTEDMLPGTDQEEEVTITYSRVPYGLVEGERYVCARWNSSINCGGGGWTTQDCSLIVTPSGDYQCKCLHQGTFTLLDIPAEPTPPPLENIPLVSRVIFYILSTASIPLYLTLIITILVTRELRCLPAMQCLVNQSLSQGLTFLVLAISFEREEVVEVCFVLGVLLQYLYLVSLSWLVAHPVLLCIKIFRRMLYEKQWLIVPFAAVCWILPAVPVAVYGSLRYERVTANTSFICWVESSLFPNTITYLTAVLVVGVLLTVLVCALCLRCSDYTVETSAYLRLSSNLPSLLLLLGVVLSQYFTAASESVHVNPDYVLLAVGAFALLCGSYFFLANAIFRSKVRNPLFCREDPVTRTKVAGYSTGQKLFHHHHHSRLEESSVGGSGQSTPQPFHRNYARRTDKVVVDSRLNNLNYVGDYLGPPRQHQLQQQLGGQQYRHGRTSTNPVPLSLFGQVQAGRVRKSGDASGLGPNPSYRLDLSSDV